MDYQRINNKDVEDIVNKYWLKEMDGQINYRAMMPKFNVEFMEGMRKAQDELIMLYFHTMNRETKERAMKTLELLRGKI